MRLQEYLRDRRWSTVLGYVLFVALMVAGYYYNITFVQLGLIDLGTRLVGMSETAVSAWMAGLALCTLVVAVLAGVTMDLLGLVPYLGAIVQFALIAVGFGAVLNTYFGLQRFEPVRLPGGAR